MKLASALAALALAACGRAPDPAAAGDAAPPGGGDADVATDTTDADIGDVVPPPSTSPLEPVWDPDRVAARIKSPAQHMRFTAGLPFRILADANDPKAYQCPPGHPPYVCADSAMTF